MWNSARHFCRCLHAQQASLARQNMGETHLAPVSCVVSSRSMDCTKVCKTCKLLPAVCTSPLNWNCLTGPHVSLPIKLEQDTGHVFNTTSAAGGVHTAWPTMAFCKTCKLCALSSTSCNPTHLEHGTDHALNPALAAGRVHTAWPAHTSLLQDSQAV